MYLNNKYVKINMFSRQKKQICFALFHGHARYPGPMAKKLRGSKRR